MHNIEIICITIQGYCISMDHFPTVLALIRSAMRQPSPAITSHVGKLVEALRAEGSVTQAEQLTKLLDGGAHSGQMEPSRVVLSRAALPGETITPNVRPPVDKETSTPLADIRFPQREAISPPIFNADLRSAVSALIEEWKQSERLKELGVRPPLNCLLYGAPGTGKTRLAHTIGSELNLPIVTARLDGLISSFLGTTARNISALFSFANRYQCVLLLDEFDAVAKVRDDPHELGEIKRVVNTLLQCLDERSHFGITVAITNHEQLLDSAIWRRFDARVLVPRPDAESRQQIVDRYIKALKVEDAERKFLVWLSEGMTGSDIETLINGLKRFEAIRSTDKFFMIEALRVQAVLSSNYRSDRRWELLMSPMDVLAPTLGADKEMQFTQEELALLFQVDQSTISRWKKKYREPEVG